MAIQFNDFLVDPTSPPLNIVIVAGVFGLIAAGFVGGARLQFFSVLAGATLFAAGLLSFASATQWFIEPSLGIFGVSFLALCNAAVVIQLISGLDSKKGRMTGFGTAVAIAILYFPLQALMSADASLVNVLAIFAITISV
jgi:peptide/nickel transport system permease protein